MSSIGAKQKTVLVVDDHDGVRLGVQRILEREGYRVEVARDGQEGIEQLRRVEIHLVLLDMDMPVMDGQEFLAAREQDARLARIPVLIYSACVQPTRLPKGAQGYIWKGADVSVLLEAVANHSKGP